ncbi:MAG: DUF3794 domain-containing protein [Ruminococcus sp.]|nr:DUF3794 domain-containing protein [Ruminococcus sp.]
MELKTNRESVPVAVYVPDIVQEQNIELDYILPDYYPDIFRLVHCEVKPVVTGYSVSGDKISYELRCDIRILYCGEGGSLLQVVQQKQSFTKSAEIGRNCDNAEISVIPKTDHINFRAVNKRRLDMRGAVSVRIKISCDETKEVISDAEGMNIQLKKSPVQFASKKLNAEKIVQINDEIELSDTQPEAVNIISVRCRADECEHKLVSGKLLVKGTVTADILYSCEQNGMNSAEPLSFDLAYSQIVDIDGIDDSCICKVTPEILCCDVSPVADKNSENRLLSCETELRLVCKAVKTSSVMLVTDAFSTVYPCEAEYTEIRAEKIPISAIENFRHTAVLSTGENTPDKVYSIWCSPKNINAHITDDGKAVAVSGMLTYSTAEKDKNGNIVMPQHDEAFEQIIEMADLSTDKPVSADVKIKDVSYNIGSDGNLTAVADISAEILTCGAESIRVVSEISVDDSIRKKRDSDYAIKLYFSSGNEDIWDIAKRYSTSVNAILEENDITGDTADENKMLLIPIVS